MTGRSFILFPGESTWRVAACEDGEVVLYDVPVSPDDDASAVHARMTAMGYSGEPVLVALPADSCLSATIDTSSVERTDRKTLLYQLEEKLPLPAESLVADFIHGGGRALGVCARADRIAPMVDDLEGAGIPVQSVTPAALLAAQAHLSDDPSDQLLLLGDAEQVDLLVIRDRAVSAWHTCPANSGDLGVALRMVLLHHPSPLPTRAIGVSPDLITAAREVRADLTTTIESDLLQLAARGGAEVLAGRRTPWVELRRDALAPSDRLRLHRPALNALLAAAAVFLIAVTTSFFLRSQRYAHSTEEAEQESREAFAAAMPGWPAPANVRDVLESELRKRKDLSPQSASESSRYSGLDMLRDLLSRFPRDVRCSIEQMTFSATVLEMSGRIHSYADADRIAAAAREASVEVPPPQVRREPDARWRFSMHGTRQAKGAESVSTAGGAQ